MTTTYTHDETKAMIDAATAGPWTSETVRTLCGVCHQIGPWPHKLRVGTTMHACIYDDYPSPPEGTDMMLANARLIAAAPDLAQMALDRMARAEKAETMLKVVLDREVETYARHDVMMDYLMAERDRLRDALAPCVNLLDGLVAESGREVGWGEEDSFRMGEWFEKHDIDLLARARAALKGTTK